MLRLLRLRAAWLLVFSLCACEKSAEPASVDQTAPGAPHIDTSSIKAFYFGHSLLAGSKASPNFHIPYNVGLFAAAKGRSYDTHGQLGWGTPISAHWAWDSDDLKAGPLGFSSENHAPFYAGRNGKAELASGSYNVVVFTDVNGNAQGAKQGPTVDALVGFIELARKKNPSALAVLYSVWNELPVADQSNVAAVKKWRDATLSELSWWESVADKVKAKTAPGRLLLVPVSAVIAELAVDAVSGRMSSSGANLDAKALFIDEVHGTSTTYYAAAAALYSALYQEPPPAAASETVQGTVSNTSVDYKLPSAEAAKHIQERAYEIVKAYPRAGLPR